tara:strand:+ start:3630 stop:5099 length:1470 start_codon:yes stop_codon:yes gene_type:complete
MAGPRPGESGANFLRRLNQESYPYFQTPQADIQDMDEYDREALRNAAYYYMKNKEVMPEPKIFLPTNDPSINTGAELLALGMTNQGLGPLVNPDDYYREVGMDEQAASSAQDISGTPLGRIDFGSGPDTSLPEVIPTEAVMQFIGKLKTMGKDKVSKPSMNRSMDRGLPEGEDGLIPILDQADAIHYHRMDGNDQRIAYTEPGEMVLPKVVGDRHPQVRRAIAEAINAEGGNPAQYISGDPEGNYDEKTGAQKFAWYDWLTKTADYVANKPWAQSAVTGVTTAGLGKLAGLDTKSALYTGLGAGLGSYVGRGAGNMFKTDEQLDEMKNMEPQDTFKGKGADYEGNLDDLKKASQGALKALSSSQGANYGAAIGAMLGQQNAPLPTPANINPSSYQTAVFPEIPPDEYFDQFEKNETPNISATVPQPFPIAPMLPAYLPEGVTYRDRVRDRETGDYRYNNSARQDQSAFARAIAGTSSRRGRGFGNMILV